jgi:hypothetical protein
MKENVERLKLAALCLSAIGSTRPTTADPATFDFVRFDTDK